MEIHKNKQQTLLYFKSSLAGGRILVCRPTPVPNKRGRPSTSPSSGSSNVDISYLPPKFERSIVFRPLPDVRQDQTSHYSNILRINRNNALQKR